MTELPERIAQLPKDHRGYPIPWNVLRAADGTPFFTVNDDRRHHQAIRERRCPICGQHLGNWKWFVGGPLSAFHEDGWYVDLPGHYECMSFALGTCPYLAAPHYEGRIDVANPSKLPKEARILINETMIPERPVLFVAVASKLVELSLANGPAMPHVRPTRPALAYEFWAHGKQIPPHRAMPILRGIFGAEWTIPATKEAN